MLVWWILAAISFCSGSEGCDLSNLPKAPKDEDNGAEAPLKTQTESPQYPQTEWVPSNQEPAGTTARPCQKESGEKRVE